MLFVRPARGHSVGAIGLMMGDYNSERLGRRRYSEEVSNSVIGQKGKEMYL